MHKFHHRSTLLCVGTHRFTKFSEITHCKTLDSLAYISAIELHTLTLQKVLADLQPLLCNPSESYRIRRNYVAVRTITPSKVVQGHQIWYQSKAHMRFPISEGRGVSPQSIPEFPLRHSSKFNKIKIHTHTHTHFIFLHIVYFIFIHFIFIKL